MEVRDIFVAGLAGLASLC